MADYQGYRTYGDRKLEIVNGKAFSANQSYLAARSPPRLPPVKTTGKSKSRSSVRPWCLSDPEMKRRKRVAGYKVYAVEGRVKASFRRSFRWIKDKCSELIHGW
ncbi:hypothetical protein AMTRI_Chr02g263980 [Amborella trichopoda]|uniref:DUF3511 domain-containing protein n=2 Tax=Amborella trichopoda TaxID=13333 RepID=U5CU19_AMBTC|nr:hypothetical protein AMTR_s00057p00084630 [Amborella trichopoda]